MFGGQSAESNRLLGAIAVVVALQPKDGGDSSGVQEAETERRRAFGGALDALLATHGEVAQELCTNHAVIASALCELIDNLAVAIANFSRSLRVPHSAGQHCLNRIYQPHKIRVGVGNLNLWHLDVGAGTLRHGTNLQGQISQVVKSFQAFLSDAVRVNCGVQHSLVLGNHMMERYGKEELVEGVDKVLVDERLQAKHGDLVGVVQASHAGCVVGNHFGQGLRILLCVSGLVEVQT